MSDSLLSLLQAIINIINKYSTVKYAVLPASDITDLNNQISQLITDSQV